MIDNTDFWNGQPKVVVTAEHIDRALKAMRADITNLEQSDVRFEGAILGGAIIAHMEAFDEHVESSHLLTAIVHAVLTNFLPDWVAGTYGMVYPTDEAAEIRQRERTQRLALRAAKAKATREAKRAAEIEVAVANRLQAAA